MSEAAQKTDSGEMVWVFPELFGGETEPSAPVVPDEDVRVLLDIIATSMDFGSGCLDTEQVVVLRRVAYMVGMDPNALTPKNMPHTFVPSEHVPDFCTYCHHNKKESFHTDPWPFTDDWTAPDAPEDAV